MKRWITSLAFILLALLGVAWSFLVWGGSRGASFWMEKADQVGPRQPVVLVFSATVIPQTVSGKISVSPASSVKLHWEDHNRKLVIVPQGRWKPEAEYRITIGGGRDVLWSSTAGEGTFRTEALPKVIQFFPADGSQDVVLDIEDPIRAAFDRPLEDYKIKFVIDPFVELDSRIDFGSRTVSLIPKADLEKGKKYQISVFIRGLDENDKAYRQIYLASFTTKPEAPKVWEKDFSLRLDQAKKYTEAQIASGKYIDINLKSQVLCIFSDGRAEDCFIISSGKRGMETPEGRFQIHNKTPRAWSKKYGLYMPYWMAVAADGSFGIHELPEWPGGYKEGAAHLGIPVSHGCIRLGVGSAEKVYNWTEIGTPVVIHY